MEKDPSDFNKQLKPLIVVVFALVVESIKLLLLFVVFDHRQSNYLDIFRTLLEGGGWGWV